jgi:RNA polymerase sigma factor FliA
MERKTGNMGRENGTARRKEAAAMAARDQIVLDNLSLVKAIAVRVHENLPVHVDLDDLVHAGVLGLFDAASKYNPDKKVVFQSYAKHRIKGAILDSLRQLDWASRDLRKRQKQLEAVTRELTARLGRTPTEQEIAETLGLGIERWRRMALELKNLGLLSASSLRSDPDNTAPIEFAAAPDSQPDRICARRQLRSALAVAMKCLPKRYQKVVFLYYSNDMTMREIGEVLGVNESRVSQIHKIALEKMAASLRSVGIESAGAF